MNKHLKHSKERMHSATITAMTAAKIPSDLSLLAPDFFSYDLINNLFMTVFLREIIAEETINFEIQKPKIDAKIKEAMKCVLAAVNDNRKSDCLIISSFTMDESPEEFVAIVVSNKTFNYK